MVSKDQLKSTLINIANNNNLTGEAVELLIDELVYSLYHSQLEISNAIQESNLSTSKLINSKIRNCMNYMYSVYRGKSVRVKLNFYSKIPMSFNKFDVIVSSNSFKVYAESPVSITSDIKKTGTPNTVIGIISKSDLIELTQVVTVNNKYYVDLKSNNIPVSNLSEDLIVYINGEEFETTRNFFDFTQQIIPLRNYDAYQIGSNTYYAYNSSWVMLDSDTEIINKLRIIGELSTKSQLPKLTNQSREMLFVLTTPDYGIRLYRRNYFNVNDEIKVKAIPYTTSSEIIESEFSKILIKSTELTSELKKSKKVSSIQEIDEETNLPTYMDNGIILEVKRDDSNSILYNANLYERVQANIQSRSDIDVLFTEFFRSKVHSSINWYDALNKKLYIFYVPIDSDIFLTQSEKLDFNNKYKSYFISDNIIIQEGIKSIIKPTIVVYKSNSESVLDQIESIYSRYRNILNDPDNLTNPNVSIFNRKQIISDISKLNNISYIDSLTYTENYSNEDIEVTDDVVFTKFINVNELNIPTYYDFEIKLIEKQ